MPIYQSMSWKLMECHKGFESCANVPRGAHVVLHFLGFSKVIYCKKTRLLQLSQKRGSIPNGFCTISEPSFLPAPRHWSWLVVSTQKKNMLFKLDHFPKIGVNIKNYLKPPPSHEWWIISDWFTGILIIAYENPPTIGWYNPLYIPPSKQFFCKKLLICQWNHHVSFFLPL